MKNDGEKLEEPSAYRSLVGSLLYLTTTRPDLMFPVGLLSRFMTPSTTRPDLMFPVGLLSRFMTSPSNIHMEIYKRILRYIKETSDLGIRYSKIGGVCLIGYADSDWVGSVDDMKSTSGYVFSIGSGAICWNAKK